MNSRQSVKLVALASLVAGTIQSAGAVNLSTDGSGQVLLYPYYTTRNGFVTSFSVTNNDAFQTKVAKVAFYEAKAGATVISFNIWLRPRDSWSASVVDRGSGAAVFSTDGTCSSPRLPTTAGTAQPFVNYYYAGQVQGVPYDNGGTSLERTREGYIEVIEMGVMADGADAASSPASAQGTSVSAAVASQNCTALQLNFNFNNGVDILSPTGKLSGSYVLINSATGVEFAQRAVALQNFFVPAGGARTSIYSNPGLETPNLSSVSPARSVVLRSSATTGGEVVTMTDWIAAGGQSIDAVTAVLSAASLDTDFDVSSNLKTEWVLSQPTKRFYVAAPTAQAAASAAAPAVGPFNRLFASALGGEARSCDQAVGVVHDGQGTARANQWGPDGTPALCWSTSSFTFSRAGDAQAASTIFGSPLAVRVDIPAGAEKGQAFVTPIRATDADPVSGPGQTSTDGRNIANLTTGGVRNIAVDGNRVRGLPVIGFAAVQGLISGQGYGGLFNVRTQPSIAP